MKIILIILTLCFTNLGNAQFISHDGELHILAGAVVSSGTYAIVYSTTKNKKKAFWMSLGASAVAGIAKEVLDSTEKENGFDKADVAATVVGGLVASFSLDLFVGKRKKKRNKTTVVLVK